MAWRSSKFLIFTWLIILFKFSKGDSLYAPGDNVLELDALNFNSSVYNQPRAFFIEFYSSWCGHCIHYKPKWVEFATFVLIYIKFINYYVTEI